MASKKSTHHTAHKTASKPRAHTTSSYSRRLEYTLVILQFVAIIGLIIGAYPSIAYEHINAIFSGIALMIAGFGLGIWAIVSFRQKVRILPSPSKRSFLVTSGVYAYIRHPMYMALLLAGTGIMLAYPTLLRGIFLAQLFIVLLIKIKIEEELLAKKYVGFDRYQKHAGMLFPHLPYRSNVRKLK